MTSFNIVKQPRAFTSKARLERLQESEEKYRALFHNANDAIFFFEVTKDGTPCQFIEVNDVACRKLGYNREELLTMTVNDLDDVERADELSVIQQELLANRRSTFETVLITKAGVKLPVEVSTHIFTLSGKTVELAIIRDITDRKRAEGEINLQKAYFQKLFENSPDGIVILDNKLKVINVNMGFENLFKFSKEEIIGCNINDFVVPEDLINEAHMMSKSVLDGKVVQKDSVRKRKGGSTLHVSMLSYPITLNDEQAGIYIIFSNISERKVAEDQLKYLSLHDYLTGLFNRNCFEQEMRRLEKEDFSSLGIIICDLDGLKLVNDTLGHEKGDSLLKKAAEVISKSFRKRDMVARIGGDEFAILMPDSDKAAVSKAVFRIRRALAKYNEAGPELPLSISIGSAVTHLTQNLKDIFKEADSNMYREKINRKQSARNAIVNALMKALEKRDFIMEGHAERLQDIVTILGKAIGLSKRRLNHLRLLAQFHDIGKVGIPDKIIFKVGPLTTEEKMEMQKHCENGHRIALSAPDLVPIADWILKHHEWWNGDGYPLGLKGREIPLECRILAIADAYDAMTSERPYRTAMTREEAVSELQRCSGTQFDLKLVQCFVKNIKMVET